MQTVTDKIREALTLRKMEPIMPREKLTMDKRSKLTATEDKVLQALYHASKRGEPERRRNSKRDRRLRG